MREEIRRLFDKQQANRWKVAGTGAGQRAEKLARLRSAIAQRRGALAAAMHADFRKSAAEVELTEIHPTLTEIRHAIDNVADWMRPRHTPTPLTLAGARSEIRSEPRGLALILSPWNYPFYLLFGPLVGAIAAGNCAILKPSEKTPATSRVMGELIAATFAEDEIALVEGGADVASALLELPFDHIFFTGSTRIGKRVMEAAAKYLASVTLELGGKSPAVIDESADLRAAAERVAFGKFVNAGQTCVAPDYALVHESVERDFIAELSRVVALFYGETEEARKKSADFPRLIDGAAFRRVKGLLDASVAAGAKIEIGGSADETERYIAPTVLSAVKPDAPIMQEEIFGPVLPVLSFRRREDAIRQIRAGDKPLALYVFGEPQAAEEILRGTTAGGSCVNNALIHLGNPDLPFGGVGASGMGNYHGVHGFRAFSHERAVLVQEMPSLIKLLYPPYGGKLRAIAAAATRLFE
jgi:aldehyde dehydrogenase (NAD+)